MKATFPEVFFKSIMKQHFHVILIFADTPFPTAAVSSAIFPGAGAHLSVPAVQFLWKENLLLKKWGAGMALSCDNTLTPLKNREKSWEVLAVEGKYREELPLSALMP